MPATVFAIINVLENHGHCGLRVGSARANETCERLNRYPAKGTHYDYIPHAAEGFFVADMGDNIKAGPFATYREAKDKADWEDMCHDYNAFRVVENRL